MKIPLNILVICLFVLSNQLFPQDNTRPKIGLVLSGGGAKGFAHIGVLEILEKEGIPIDYIVGTSIGSIIGGLYSIGYNSKQLKEFATTQEWRKLISDYISREYKNSYEKYDQDRYLVSFKLNAEEGISLPAGVVQGHNVMNMLCRLTAKYHETRDFSKFPIPFACVAADLETGKEVIIKNGFLPDAMFASMSIPTIFSPSDIQEKLVVDGGIVNNFPTDIAKQMGADIIIGIDIQTKPLAREEIGDLMDIVTQMISYLGYEKYIENKKLCDVIVEPDITGFGTTSFSNESADTLIRRGNLAAQSQIESIKKILIDNKIDLVNHDREYTFDQKFTLNNFMVEGINETTVDYLLDKSDFTFPRKYSFEDIDEGIKRLYGSGNFKKAYYQLFNSSNKTFRLVIDEKTANSLNAGFNFNSIDKAAILLNLTVRNEFFKGTRLSFDAKLSTNTTLGASFQFSNKSLPEIDLSSVYKNFTIEVYEKNNKLSEADVRYFNNSFSISEIIGSNYLLNLGLRSEYYKFDPFFSEDATTDISAHENTILSLFGKIRFDNLNDKYYPSSGFDLNAEFSYTSNKANNIIENSTTPILFYSLKSAISLGSDFTIIPSFYGRLLLNENTELFRSNALGGTESTQLLDYHLPFVGVRRVILTKDKTLISKLEGRVRLAEDNYLSFILNGATHFNKFKDWQTRELIGGYGLKYSYNSFIGPIDLLLSTSDYTDKIDFFINVGRWF